MPRTPRITVPAFLLATALCSSPFARAGTDPLASRSREAAGSFQNVGGELGWHGGEDE